jgi:hypothetical protein
MKISVDKVVVLTLEKNEKKIKNKFDPLFPKKQLEYYITKGVGTTQNDGTMNSSLWKIMCHDTIDKISIDIFKNHVNIIKKCFHNPNIQTVLILEDDAYFPNWDQVKWNKTEQWLQQNPQRWDIFFLGYCNWPTMWSKITTRNIVKLSSPLTAHAYILNKNGMFKILKTIEKNPHCKKMHIDKLFTKIPKFYKYGSFPMVSFQEKCPGLYLKACDKMGVRVLFSTCCKWNEWVSVILPIIVYLFLLVICLYFVWKFRK